LLTIKIYIIFEFKEITMKKKELLEYVPRKDNVLVHAVQKPQNLIITPSNADKDNTMYTLTVLKIGPNVEDLNEGDEIFVAGGPMIPIAIEDADENEIFTYIHEAFIKLRKKNE